MQFILLRETLSFQVQLPLNQSQPVVGVARNHPPLLKAEVLCKVQMALLYVRNINSLYLPPFDFIFFTSNSYFTIVP